MKKQCACCGETVERKTIPLDTWVFCSQSCYWDFKRISGEVHTTYRNGSPWVRKFKSKTELRAILKHVINKEVRILIN